MIFKRVLIFPIIVIIGFVAWLEIGLSLLLTRIFGDE
jgi:hypothetical protein